MIVIYDTLGAYGGSHTLMLRMCQWMSENNINSAIVCKDDSNTEIVSKMREYGVKIIRADLSDAKSGAFIIKELINEEPIKVINFSWNNYLDVERIKKKSKIEFDNYLYCIHPETFKKGVGFKTKFMRSYSKNSYRKIFERMNENNAIISLDEINISESEKYLECTLNTKPEIIRLPMYCEKRDDFEDIISNGFNSKTILTAARADFPYKGYLLGLINDYSKLKDKYPELKLEIVSSGDDYDQLLDRIHSIPDGQQKDIILHGWMDYDELKRLIRGCRMFIGMCTSVFDASLQYKPSIVVRFSTLENFSDHFVFEKPEYMGSDVDCIDPAINRIERALNWDFEEYRKNSILSFDCVKALYDIDVCMDKLIQSATKNRGSILTVFECLRHSINHKVNAVRFRNRKFADYNDLVKEKA